MKLFSFLILFLLVTASCSVTEELNLIQVDRENISINQLTENTYQHISYLETDDFGKVSCNGVVVVSKGEAVVLDAPTNEKAASDLINWIEKDLSCTVVAVVATHFHKDCLGGLQAFHTRNIPSYASLHTKELAYNAGSIVPQNGFYEYLELEVGNKIVINEFLGEGHTRDNIISYFPEDNVLFGGCLIKALNANKGYLGDANEYEWPNTVKKVMLKYASAQVIVPGHGNPGGLDLLNYTIKLFSPEFQ